MENIIVEIALAANGETVDFMLPAHVPVQNLMKELTQVVEQVYQQIATNQPLLINQSLQQIIPPNQTLAQAGVRDGQRLMLV